MLTPKYDAYTTVRITPNGQSPLDTEAADRPFDQMAVNTEVSVIASRNVARKVVIQQDLYRDPEFVVVKKDQPAPDRAEALLTGSRSAAMKRAMLSQSASARSILSRRRGSSTASRKPMSPAPPRRW
jgi:uncharacterized protein involved in exopolysaccharide biosynthesis